MKNITKITTNKVSIIHEDLSVAKMSAKLQCHSEIMMMSCNAWKSHANKRNLR